MLFTLSLARISLIIFCSPIFTIVNDITCTLFARWFLKNIEGFRENGAKLLNNGPYVLAKLAGLKARKKWVVGLCFRGYSTTLFN